MKAYKYDKDTLEYKGTIELQLDPVTQKDYLEPPYISKTPAPPIKDLYAIYYIPGTDSWEYREDPRQGEWYSKETGQLEFASEIKDTSDYTRIKPTVPNPKWVDGGWTVDVDALKETVKYILQRVKQDMLQETIEYNEKEYLPNDSTLTALTRLSNYSEDTVLFRTNDNSYVELTKEDISNILNALTEQEQKTLKWFWENKDALKELTTYEEVKEFIRVNIDTTYYDEQVEKILQG